MKYKIAAIFAVLTALIATFAIISTSFVGMPLASAAPVTGTYKPSPSNVGIPPGTVLTPLGTPNQPLIITVDGTVIDGKDIYGDIKVRARDVKIKNSRIHCGSYVPTGPSGCIDANSDAVFGLKIFNNTIDPDKPHYFRDGVVGHEYWAARNIVRRTTDGFGAFNKAKVSKLTNVTIEANYVENLTYWKYDAGIHADGTHNDGVQVQGGQNIKIMWNTIKNTGWAAAGTDPAKPGAPAPHGHGCAIILQNNTGTPLVNVVVEDNWIDDGLASVCVKPGQVTLQRNKFGRNQWPYKNTYGKQFFVIRVDSRAGTIINGLSTNVWEDTGVKLKEGKDYGTVRAGIWYNQ